MLLYVRMIFLMLISLYTSRIVLAALGIEDYGLYNVVGGIVSVLSFLNTSMATATQRFLNVELGRSDQSRLKVVFATSQFIHFSIAGVILLLCETLGVWFLNTHMTIAPDRIEAANWVFQFSILSVLITVISVPYHAAIIAHEKMSAFAYISIIEALLKLLIVFAINLSPVDKLIFYSSLMALKSIAIRLLYSWYCAKNFEECKVFRLKPELPVLKRMAGFSGWTIVGALGSISHTQGVAVVINMFFNVAVNAAQGIANQVINIVNHFVTNFMIALNPQIVKSYAAGDLEGMHTLLQRGCRIGLCMMILFAIPIIIETPVLLGIWLEKVPDYSVIFIRIIMLTAVCNSFASPLSAARGATGDIKNYQIILTTLGLLHIPLAWISFKAGAEPYAAMLIYLLLVIVMQAFRIFMSCRGIGLSIVSFCKNVLLRGFAVLALALVLPLTVYQVVSESIVGCIVVCAVSVLTTMAVIYLVGLTHVERIMALDLAKRKLRRS